MRLESKKHLEDIRRAATLIRDFPSFPRSSVGMHIPNATKTDPNFIESETPYFVGKAVAALAADPTIMEKSGRVFSSWGLADE